MSEPVRELAPREVPQQQDIPTLMAQIRERIKSDIERNLDSRSGISRATARFADERGISFGDMQLSEELKFLNRSFSYQDLISKNRVTTHRTGLLGRLLVKVKGRLVEFVRKVALKDYLQAEEGFNINLVRFLNDMARYIDARDTNGLSALARVDDEKSLAILLTGHQLRELRGSFEERLKTMDALVRGLEGMINNIKTYIDPSPPLASEKLQTTPALKADTSYLLFENRFRGSKDEIARRLAIYPEIFKNAQAPVLEIGSGRGELQLLFKQGDIPSYGVDLDVVMVNVANSSGCTTQYGDAIAHLRGLADRSLGGLVAVQLVEHLTHAHLKELFELAKKKLRSGAKVAFETINPQSVLALSSNYFRDPTHIWPLHPDTLAYMATLAGLKIIETKMLSPVSPNHLLKDIPSDSSHTAAVTEALSRINLSFQQLNRLLYGYQDYCLILEVQ